MLHIQWGLENLGYAKYLEKRRDTLTLLWSNTRNYNKSVVKGECNC